MSLRPGIPVGTIEVATYDAPDVAVLTVGHAGTGTGSVTSDPAGIDCGADCDELYPYGTLVTLTPSAAVGSSGSASWVPSDPRRPLTRWRSSRPRR